VVLSDIRHNPVCIVGLVIDALMVVLIVVKVLFWKIV
jgi:hypothetical protein